MATSKDNHIINITTIKQDFTKKDVTKMLGIIYSMLAGFFITVQGVFNTRVGEKIGILETTAFVHVIGLASAILASYLWGQGSFKRLGEVNKLYLIGGMFGVIIVYSIMSSFTLLGPTFAISILLVTQLLVGLAIDTLGLFGTEKIALVITKPIGILIMLAGIFVFQLK